MKHFLLIVFAAITIIVKSQTCVALYSYGANFNNVHFFNQSSAANAHYYWNFGDGTGSNLKDPIHEYSENGIYLVTLYVNDTLSNCSNYYEQWLTITKYTIDPCSPYINDSIYFDENSYFKYNLKIIDNSLNCGTYSAVYKVGAFAGSASDNIGLGWYPGNYLASGYYFDIASVLKRVAIKTSPTRYNRALNYNSCSANFEMLQISENMYGQRILFKAMNKNAIKYDWIIPGFGDPIRSTNDTLSVYYPDSPNSVFPNLAHDAILTIKEQNGCRDSLRQFVVIKTKKDTYVGISTINNETLNVGVYPNPVKNKLNLEFGPSKIRIDKLTITNTLGQIIFVLNEPQPKQDIDLSFLVSGVYFVTLRQAQDEGGRQKVVKIIKE